jgi:hypothetical protein
MKSTDKAAAETSCITRHDNHFGHIKRYVSQELARYPIYKQMIDDTKAELNELRNHLALCCKVTDGIGGGRSGAVSNSVEEYNIKISILDENLKHYRWRMRKTAMGLKYFENNKEIMKLINLKYFVCHDWDNATLLTKLGYGTRPDRYYRNIKTIVEIFGKFYGVMP